MDPTIERLRAELPRPALAILECSRRQRPFTIGTAEMPPRVLAIAVSCANDAQRLNETHGTIRAASDDERRESMADVVAWTRGEDPAYPFWADAPGAKPRMQIPSLQAGQIAFVRVLEKVGGPLRAYREALEKLGGKVPPRELRAEWRATVRALAGLRFAADDAEGGSA